MYNYSNAFSRHVKREDSANFIDFIFISDI